MGMVLLLPSGGAVGVASHYPRISSAQEILSGHFVVVAPLQVNITESSTPGNAGVNENLTAHASGGTPPYSFFWNGGETGPGPVAAMLIFPGTFDYTVIATDATGATAVAQYNLTVPPPGNVGNTFSFSASVVSDTPTPSGAVVSFTSSYSRNSAPVQFIEWDFGDGGTSLAQNPTHPFNATGEYRVVATARTNANYSGGGTSASYVIDVLVEVEWCEETG